MNVTARGGAAAQIDDEDLDGAGAGGSADEVPEPSLRETIEDAAAEAFARDKGEDPSAEGERTRTQSSEATSGRDERGRFIRGARSAEPAAATTTNASSKEGAGAATGQPIIEPPAAAGADAPPRAWNAQEQGLWKDIPAPVKAAIARREADVHRALSTYDGARRVGNDFAKVATEFQQLVKYRGGNPIALVRETFAQLHQLYGSTPQQRATLLRDIASRMGADMSAFTAGAKPAAGAVTPGVQPNGAQPQTVALPPEVQTRIDQMSAYIARQQQHEQRQQQEQQQRQEAEMAQATGEIEAFRSDPAHSHYDTVSDLMISLLNGGAAQTLEEAYGLAVKAHPEVSKQLETEARAAADAAQRQRALALKARQKGGGVRGAPGRVPDSQSGSRGSVRDDLLAAAAEARSRV